MLAWCAASLSRCCCTDMTDGTDAAPNPARDSLRQAPARQRDMQHGPPFRLDNWERARGVWSLLASPALVNGRSRKLGRLSLGCTVSVPQFVGHGPLPVLQVELGQRGQRRNVGAFGDGREHLMAHELAAVTSAPASSVAASLEKEWHYRAGSHVQHGLGVRHRSISSRDCRRRRRCFGRIRGRSASRQTRKRRRGIDADVRGVAAHVALLDRVPEGINGLQGREDERGDPPRNDDDIESPAT